MLIPFEGKKKFKPTVSYKEWLGPTSTNQKMRGMFRSLAIGALSVGKGIGNTANWIRFPYYHHVFSDEIQSITFSQPSLEDVFVQKTGYQFKDIENKSIK